MLAGYQWGIAARQCCRTMKTAYRLTAGDPILRTPKFWPGQARRPQRI
jgi:hypothetical protein